jgi:RNA polymerase sigma-70 factor (ECF subfamily)
MQVDRAQQDPTLEKFMAAVTSGDVQGLVEVLAPEVVLKTFRKYIDVTTPM